MQSGPSSLRPLRHSQSIWDFLSALKRGSPSCFPIAPASAFAHFCGIHKLKVLPFLLYRLPQPSAFIADEHQVDYMKMGRSARPHN